MNNIVKNASWILVLISLLYTLAGCSGQPTLSTITSNTPMVTSTKSLSATPQVQVSRTFTPTINPSITPTVTWTPLPTLSVDQARKTIIELLSSNGGCELPCWWGIVPGKTPWAEALHFLAPLSEIKQGGSGNFTENGKTHYATGFDVYYVVPNGKEKGRMLLAVTDNQVTGITVFSPDTKYNYQLPQILKLFGKPSQIYMSAQPYTQTNELLPAIVVLDYSNIGVIASYEFPLHKVGENLRICPAPVGARLELWDPKIKYSRTQSIDEYVSMITGFGPKKLEDVSKMSTDLFYETFQNPNTTICVETPIGLWP